MQPYYTEFLQHVLRKTVELRRLTLEQGNAGNIWIKQCKEYMINIGITIEELEETDSEDLKKKIKRKEKENWKSRMQKKPSLKLYRNY